MATQLPDPIKIVKRIGDIRLHTFVSAFTDDNIANATHIIEGKSKLVLVDGQFLKTYAAEFRKYANHLATVTRKPIERLYLSHRHPDHWFGLGTAFDDIAIYALPETIEFLKEHGEASRKDHLKKLGSEAPGKLVIPQNTVGLDERKHESEETIDGLKYIFHRVTNTEIDFLLTISLPELGVYITQDLIYSRTHLYLPSAPTVKEAIKAMGDWIRVLEDLLVSDYELFMPGHGFPADKIEVAGNIEYLAAAKNAIDNGMTKYDFKSFMLQRYPARLCPGIFATYLPRLFDGVSDY